MADSPISSGATKQADCISNHALANGGCSDHKRDREDDGGGISSDVTDNLIQTEEARPTKRKRTDICDSGASVQVTFQKLSRESKAKLTESLQYWAQWHAQHQSSAVAATESGTVVYFPPVSSGDSLFWVDKPRISQGRGESATLEPGISIKDFNVRYEQDGEVPQYDRGAHAPLRAETSQENGIGEGVYLRVEKDAPRCWNCASYTHSARDCPKPWDQEAFNAAREEFQAKKGSRPGESSQRRYFEGGLFDDLKPGQLTAPLREALGIQPDDPPPWFHRMQELGYPPAYLANDDDGPESPSGIEIFGMDEGGDFGAPSTDAVENAPAADVSKSSKMLVAFPGINAPIPEGADPRKWAARPVVEHLDGGHVSRGRWDAHLGPASSQGAAFSYPGQSLGGTEVGGSGAGAWGSYQGGQLAGQLAGHDRQLAGEWRSDGGEGNASAGREKISRWDLQQPADYSQSWPGSSTFLGTAGHINVEEPGGWSQASVYATGGWNGTAVALESVQNGGGRDGEEFGDEPLPPGYEHAQPWQADPTYAYQNQTDSQDVQPYSYEQPQLPPPSHGPSPPLPPWHTPSPPPPPSYSPPPPPPGYEDPREVTPPPYTQFQPGYGAAQVTYESPAAPESYYTPEQQFPPVNQHPWQTQQQPQPSGHTGNGWEQTWGGFWPQNH